MNRSGSFLASPIETLETRTLFATLVVAGTPGNDTINVTADAIYVTISINGDITRAKAVRDFTISGGTGNDVITVAQSMTVPGIISGNSGNDTIYGGGGADTITGNNGNDYIDGYNGDDDIIGNDGADTLYGNAGNDSVFATDGSTNSDGDLDTIFEFYNDPGTDDIHYSLPEDLLRHSI